jgi:hypothetical protein
VTTEIQKASVGTEPAHTTRTGKRWCIALLALLGIVMTVVECGTRIFLPRISRIESRIVREYSQAIAPVPAGRQMVLFTGNSLLDAGVQFDRVRQAFSNKFEARRFMVEQTVYHDWRYGLQHLFDEGARPKVVVLMLNAAHLVSNGSRGEYSAYLLTSHGDIINLCRDLHLHPTNAANMVFANYSMFYADRSEIRKVILGRIIPDLPHLTMRLTTVPAPDISEERLRSVVRTRAAVLREECSRRGARLVLALPPGIRYDQLQTVRSAAAESRVVTLLPFSAQDYGPGDYADGFHLNETGAGKFTSQLIQAVGQSAGAWFQN